MTFKSGDLVMVVRPTPCCGRDDAVGTVYVVTEMVVTQKHTCMRCGGITVGELAARTGEIGKSGAKRAYRASRLRLIPPLDEPEAITVDEPIEVTA